jgi:hypothetical protein
LQRFADNDEVHSVDEKNVVVADIDGADIWWLGQRRISGKECWQGAVVPRKAR